MDPQPESHWKVLDWDSEFFGFRIARAFAAHSNVALNSIIDECATQGVRCLYFLAEADDIATIRILEQEDFGFVDVRLTLSHRFPAAEHLSDISGVRPARPEDLPELERIARISHHDTRFYTDPQFPRDRCDALYATWIFRSVTEKFADAVFVASATSTRADGYITCSMIRPDQAQIGLLAVAPEARGTGSGKKLINQALSWARSQGAESVITVTQGRNVAAVRTYERCGFVSDRLQLWYHCWFEHAR